MGPFRLGCTSKSLNHWGDSGRLERSIRKENRPPASSVVAFTLPSDPSKLEISTGAPSILKAEADSTGSVT
ncbi:hypothetical protein D3C86_2220970 [compost metagenome]